MSITESCQKPDYLWLKQPECRPRPWLHLDFGKLPVALRLVPVLWHFCVQVAVVDITFPFPDHVTCHMCVMSGTGTFIH